MWYQAASNLVLYSWQLICNQVQSTFKVPSEEAEQHCMPSEPGKKRRLLVRALLRLYTVLSYTLAWSHMATCPFLSPLNTMLSLVG